MTTPKDKVAVVFTKSYAPYNPEDVAAFPSDVSKRLVDNGVAVYYHEESEPKKPRERPKLQDSDKDKMMNDDRGAGYQTKG